MYNDYIYIYIYIKKLVMDYKDWFFFSPFLSLTNKKSENKQWVTEIETAFQCFWVIGKWVKCGSINVFP